MKSRALVTAFTLAACGYDDKLQQAYAYPPLPAESTGALTDASTSAASATDGATGGSGGSSETTTDTTGAESTSGDATTEAASTGEAVAPPEILAVDMPAKITFAGPVAVSALVKGATSVRGLRNGTETVLFTKDEDLENDGVVGFSAVLEFYGSVDNGDEHTLEVIAERGELKDSATHQFEVAAPAAGIIAWDRLGGPGSRTNRLALDAEGVVFEGGALEIGGFERPALRKRDPATGNDLWPGGWISVDSRKGYVADLTVAPDGRLWVAMNVLDGNTWRARLALLEPDTQPTGIELEKPGTTVTAIDNDGDGGCFAGGHAPTIHGDVDIVMFRIAGDGTPIASGHPWDYVPKDDNQKAHWFTDLAFDVVVDAQVGEAWIVGASQGKHNKLETQVRGMLVRVDLDTLEVLDPVVIAPTVGALTQSTFHSGALDPAGLLISGHECNWNCTTQRVVAYRYSAGGGGTVIHSGDMTSAAFASSIARNAHGAILIAANIKDGPTMRGSLLGFRDDVQTFAPLSFPGKGASAASSVVVGPYDWAFAGGQATVDGAPQAYVMRPHQ